MDLWHTTNEIFRFKLFCAIRPESSKRTFKVSTRGKFLAQNWIYGCSSRFLIIWARREKFRKRRNIIEASANNAWKLILPANEDRKFAGDPQRDFRFTLYWHREPANPVNFHECSIRYIFKLILVVFGNARTFQRTIRFKDFFIIQKMSESSNGCLCSRPLIRCTSEKSSQRISYG